MNLHLFNITTYAEHLLKFYESNYTSHWPKPGARNESVQSSCNQLNVFSYVKIILDINTINK